MTCAYLHELAQSKEAHASEEEKNIDNLGGLHAELGNLLQQKFQGAAGDAKKHKEFFDVMDKNKDGSISKMEVEIALRPL